MKMMYAGLLSDPNLEPEQLRFNCTRNPALQKAFYIPIRNIAQIDLYFELPFLPLSYSINLIDYCNSGEIALTSDLYVIGEHPNGFYGVFSNLVAAGEVPTLFYIKGEFVAVDGTTTAIFFSNEFSTIDCGNLTKVEGCYNNATTGTEAYDINGVYYGFPINSNFLGNQLWRYFHSVDVRLGKVTNTKHKLSLSLFNSSRNYKSTTEKTYNFQSELVPEFYKDEIAGVITRGNITINGKPYTLSSDVELSVLSEDSELWPIDIPLTDNIDTFFSCKETVCRTLGEPPPLCCDPIVNFTQIEVIDNVGRVVNSTNDAPITQVYVSLDANPSGAQLVTVSSPYPIAHNTQTPATIPDDFNDIPGVSVIIYFNNNGLGGIGKSLRVTDSLGVVRCVIGDNLPFGIIDGVIVVPGCRLSNSLGFTIQLFTGSC